VPCPCMKCMIDREFIGSICHSFQHTKGKTATTKGIDPHTVQLTDKALPVVVLEEPWQDGVRELDTVVDIEHISFLGPRDEMLNRWIFYHPIVYHEQSKI